MLFLGVSHVTPTLTALGLCSVAFDQVATWKAGSTERRRILLGGPRRVTSGRLCGRHWPPLHLPPDHRPCQATGLRDGGVSNTSVVQKGQTLPGEDQAGPRQGTGRCSRRALPSSSEHPRALRPPLQPELPWGHLFVCLPPRPLSAAATTQHLHT